MADVNQVLIEFIASTEGLEPAIDKLEALGKVDKAAATVFKQTNTELNRRTKELAAVQASSAKVSQETTKIKTSIADVDKQFKNFSKSFAAGFKEGVTEELKRAGLSAEEFAAAIKTGNTEAGKSTETLRTRMRQLTEQLTLLKVQGKDNTEQYRKLSQEAAKLKDAMGDVSAEIRNIGSDTAVFDGLLNAAQGIAGGFAIAQGAAALFGDESEELQEVLLRVNAAMAILQGLQAVGNVLQKESAAAKLADVIVTKSQIAAQRLYAFVIGTSTGALKAFRIALAATGIGLFLIIIGKLISSLDIFTTSTKASEFATRKFAESLDLLRVKSDDAIQSVKNQTELVLTKLEAAGAKRSELALQGFNRDVKLLQALDKEVLASQQRQLQIQKEYANINSEVDREESQKQLKTEQEREKELRKQRAETQRQITLDLIKRKQLVADEAKAEAEEQKKLNEKAAADAREANLARLNDELAAIELRRLKVKENTQAEIDIQKEIIAKKAEIELEAEKLTANQRKLIREQSLKDQLDLQAEFNKKSSRLELESLIERNNALLENIEISSDERLRLTIENITTQAQLEIEAAEGNADKIKAINAKRDTDIKAARLRSIQETLDYELSLESKREGASLRALQKIVDNETASVAARIAAIDELTNYDLSQNKRREDALNDSFSNGLISLKQYNIDYATLQDEQNQILEKATDKKNKIIEDGLKNEADNFDKWLQRGFETANQLVGLADAIFKARTDRENQRIEEQRRKVSELREAGVITEKEEIKRLKTIDAEEKKVRRTQAQRDKAIGIFQAIISTAAGIAKAIPNLALMAFAAAIGAAQIAIIASRPIPKFRTGKKDSYEGPGLIGEAGSEVWERNGKHYLAEKPTFVWIGKKDKVFSPEETSRRFLNKQQPSINKNLLTVVNNHKEKSIDYDVLAKKIGDQVAKKVPVHITNITEKGMSKLVKEGNFETEYLADRRKFT